MKGISVRTRLSIVLATGVVATTMLSGCGGDGSDSDGLDSSDSPVVTDDDGDPMLTGPGSGGSFSTADADGADCDTPSPELKDGLSWVTVIGAPVGVAADDTSFEISVAERDCTGGPSPGESLHAPYVVKTDDAVTLYMAMTSPATPSTPPSDAPSDTKSGGADGRYCATNPVVYGTVDLGEALGQRALYDGSTWPPTKLE